MRVSRDVTRDVWDILYAARRALNIRPCGAGVALDESDTAAMYCGDAAGFTNGSSSSDQAALRRIQRSLTRRAEQGDLALDAGEAGGGSSWRGRKAKIVAPVFHGLGLVVPFDKEADVGWRPLPESDRDLKRAWSRVQDSEPRRRDTSPLDEIVTWATIANDECDFGMGLQLGHDLLAWERQDGAGKHVLGPYIEQIMPISYMLLDRMPFMEVLTAHLKHRYRERRSAVGLGL